MTVEKSRNHKSERKSPDLRQARRIVVQKVTQAVLAIADALEVEKEKEPWDCIDFQSVLRNADADPGLIREFLNSPVYRWVMNDYVAGKTSGNFLCQVVEILHELAPSVFRLPRY
jgi:hypothetical protein